MLQIIRFNLNHPVKRKGLKGASINRAKLHSHQTHDNCYTAYIQYYHYLYQRPFFDDAGLLTKNVF
jgi:hypothetical protein